MDEFQINTIQMLGKKDDNGQRQNAPSSQGNGRNSYADAKNGAGYTQNPDDDDIPF